MGREGMFAFTAYWPRVYSPFVSIIAYPDPVGFPLPVTAAPFIKRFYQKYPPKQGIQNLLQPKTR